MPLLPYLQLMRPANVVTAAADILLGAVAAYALAGHASAHRILPEEGGLGWLLLASCALYAGGVVLNDVFDAGIDREERPERPIPSGRIGVRRAALFGALLLLLGLVAAGMAGTRSGWIAVLTAAFILLYDAYAKQHAWFGPLTMGLCRGGNLLLGLSILPLSTAGLALAGLPVLYIFAITLISRGEVGGGNRRSLYLALAIYSLVVLIMLTLLLGSGHSILLGLPFILLFGRMIFPPLWRAVQEPSGPRIGQAVRSAVLALIVFDAALGAALAGWPAGLMIIVLLPFSLILGAFFAVT